MNNKARILKDGKPLDDTLYSIDFKTKVFSSRESNLVLDFSTLPGWTFRVSSGCKFITSFNCVFKTGKNCTFTTSFNCIFKTGTYCTFNTGGGCTFRTGSNCTFNTGRSRSMKGSVFLVWDINSQHFKYSNDNSIILDSCDGKHYLLTEELIKMFKVTNG